MRIGNKIKNYITPQAEFADIVFSIEPDNEKYIDLCINNLKNDKAIEQMPKFKLRIKSNIISKSLELHKILVGIYGLNIERRLPDQFEKEEIIIEGEIKKEDIKMASVRLLNMQDDLLDFNPRWQDEI